MKTNASLLHIGHRKPSTCLDTHGAFEFIDPIPMDIRPQFFMTHIPMAIPQPQSMTKYKPQSSTTPELQRPSDSVTPKPSGPEIPQELTFAQRVDQYHKDFGTENVVEYEYVPSLSLYRQRVWMHRDVVAVDRHLTPLSLANENWRSPMVMSTEDRKNVWKSKELHGVLQGPNRPDVDLLASVTWLRFGTSLGTEGFVCAIADEVIMTNTTEVYPEDVRSTFGRACRRPGESLRHIISGCSHLANVPHPSPHHLDRASPGRGVKGELRYLRDYSPPACRRVDAAVKPRTVIIRSTSPRRRAGGMLAANDHRGTAACSLRVRRVRAGFPLLRETAGKNASVHKLLRHSNAGLHLVDFHPF
ncbi:hypothetical protein MSG28_010058 [Choristoneura fumiferana]|uniref:Uncharacterized protein n=1 Tax=Choristoneura fumiferana TaxID=7141 RepID=A0ACC0KJB4_CHOFU|nr:hypothetical protein MSG28_010058 [Choristoneura fumiferana]